MTKSIWSLFFLTIPVLGTLIFGLAYCGWPPFEGAWLPKNINPRAATIDHLFVLVLYLTGSVFLLVGLLFVWAIWSRPLPDSAISNNQCAKSPLEKKPRLSEGQIEWGLFGILFCLLLGLILYQTSIWSATTGYKPIANDETNQKQSPPNKTRLQQSFARITARQFEWDIRYAGVDGLLDTEDDVLTTNFLLLPKGELVVLELRSQDVIHSFFAPNFRIKQDILPGRTHYIWFEATEEGKYEFLCAELCGWGHFKMAGELHVVTAEESKEWLTRGGINKDPL